MHVDSTVIPNTSGDVLRLILPYQITSSDQRFRQRIRTQRRNKCERCGASGEKAGIQCHLVLDARVHPEFAREPANVIVVCEPCRSLVTSATHAQVWEDDSRTKRIQEFYGALPAEVGRRVAAFLDKNAPQLKRIIAVCQR
jgi:hypothetical protein